MNHFFILAYIYFLSHKKLLIGLLVFLTIGFTFSLLHLNYKEDIAEFLPDNETNEQINAVYQHIGNSNQLIVNFSLKDTTTHDTERIMDAIDQFTILLNERDSLRIIPNVISQVDESQFFELTNFIQQHAPYFLTETDYERIDRMLSDESIISQLNEDKRLLMLPSGGLMKQNMAADPLHLFSPLLLKLKDFQAGDNGEVNDGYIFSHNGKKGMVILSSPYGISETAGNAKLLEMINNTIQETALAFPELKISCFGASAIAVTNAEQIKRDSLLAIVLAVVLILVLLIYFFRNGRNLFLIFFSVLFGWLFALGTLALFKDSISAIAIGISSIFVGIAINYPLHFIDHLRHQKNRKQALKEIIPPLLIGNITTVGAFLSLIFIDSNAMRDLGLFGSLLLVGTILFVLLFLPHLLKRSKEDKKTEKFFFNRLSSFAPERKKWIMWMVLALTIVFLYLSQFTTFESDMNSINYMTDQQREDMNDMLQSIEKKDREIVYYVCEGKQMNDALSVYEQNSLLLDSLREKGLIESISGIGNFLSSQEEQQKRINRWNEFWKPRRESLIQQIEQESAKLGFKQGSFDEFSQLLFSEFTPQEESYFSPIASLLAENYLIRGDDRNIVICLLYCDKQNTELLKEALKNDSNQAFFFDARSAGERMVDSLSDDFNYVLYICGFIVFIFLTFSFGRLELSFLSFLPLAVSWVWILGIMQLGNMQFNIVNIILATFIFGQGDDYTIFITEGLMYEYAYRRKMLNSYKNSIILSALIMFIGIGTLIFAKHPAMRSLAEVTIVGMFSVVIMAYIIPPFIFRWLTTNKYGFRKVPITIKRLGSSVYAFTVFLFGSLIITITGFTLFSFGKKSEKKRNRYHFILYWVANFVVKHIPRVAFKYENLSEESFDKPSVIISNHQSHLDLMCLMMLTPKLIILTNDWVWNNPLYGRLIKYGDFYPVSNGVEQSVEKLSERVQNGYSIVVFPEGTRSEDCSILRFHRGAFYLAEKLNLDILPVFIHGAGHVLRKKDFMLRKGSITVQVHPRITHNDSRFAPDYASRTKQVRHYYQNTFKALSEKLETAAYFKSFVLHNYLYKGAKVEHLARETMKKLKKLDLIDTYQGEGPVLIKNNGEGVFSFLFALVHKNIQVIATEQDEEKVALANSCAGLPENLTVYKDEELPADIKFETIIETNINI
jgi:1-acyl-sn-glycerol-3-phosphate acyltransferase